uniref:Uncharacterized protein n=1 Tax=Timema tahoe TaxID=61484 RepID=A0A7R9IEH6_9NEOP|nr:unnamed protein product [Timema tahoe]
MASLVLTDSSQLTADGFEKLPDQIMKNLARCTRSKSIPDLPLFGSLLQLKSSALDRTTTEVDLEILIVLLDTPLSVQLQPCLCTSSDTSLTGQWRGPPSIMSMTGSLMPFENNNDVNGKGKGGGGGGGAGGSGGGSKGKPQIQPKQAAGSVGSGAARSQGKGACFRAHLNSLWSVWYGLCATGLQGYIALQCVRRFLNYVELPWPVGKTPPRLELHACLGLTGAAILLLPFFLTSALLKIGNLANDGFKLGRHLTACTADPPSVLLGAGGGLGRRGTGVIRSLWQHGGPTAPFLHLATAFCLLLPKLLMEARLVHAGFLPKDDAKNSGPHLILIPSPGLSVEWQNSVESVAGGTDVVDAS